MPEPQDVRTGLVELSTLKLCSFPISAMPSYLAVSHVWYERLFKPSDFSRRRNTVSKKSRGMNMLRTFLKQRSNLPKVQYCWVDIWCIDQEDADDKVRQIPMMGTIYKNAQYVAVVVKHAFSFDQDHWDAVVSKLQPAFEFVRTDHNWQTLDALACYSTLESSSNLAAARKMLEELTSMAWFRRVWTAQEYLLARDVFWIGLDDRSLHLREKDIHCIALMMSVKIGSRPTEPYAERLLPGELLSLTAMHEIRLNGFHPTRALDLAVNRECKYPQDAIYGLMAASGVIIPSDYGLDMETIWTKWWEQAIADDHVMWIMMGMSRAYYPREFFSSGSCIRPPSAFRNHAFASSGLARMGIRPYGPLESRQGTVGVTSRLVGSCRFEKYLGDLPENEWDAVQEVAKAGGTETLVKVLVAMTSGQHTLYEIEEYSKWLRANPSPDPSNHNPISAYENVEEPQQLRLKPGIPLSGRIYLGSIENCNGSTTVLINAAEMTECGECLAIDVGSRWDNPKDDPNRYDHRMLMIVQVRQGRDWRTEVLHKVGITSPVFIPEISKGGADKFERARRWNGLIFEDKYERLRIGGDSCPYCHPGKSVELGAEP